MPVKNLVFAGNSLQDGLFVLKAQDGNIPILCMVDFQFVASLLGVGKSERDMVIALVDGANLTKIKAAIVDFYQDHEVNTRGELLVS